MSDAHDDRDGADRAAILARRKHFIARTLDGVDALRGDALTRAGRRTKAAALAIGGLAIACPCLDVAPPDTGEEEEGPTPDMPDESNTETGAQTGTAGGDAATPARDEQAP